MGKKQKLKKAQTVETVNGSTSVDASPEIDYRRPFSSYGIPGSFLGKYPRFPQPSSPFSTIIVLHDVHEDAGHTLVHFLYSGEYETINAPLGEATSDIAREYKKSIFVYQASRKYGIDTLEAHALKYIQRFGDGLSFPEMLRITRDVFSTLPEGETWLPCYINTRLRHMLEPSRVPCSLEDIYNILGQNNHFDSVLLKMVVEILSVRLSFRGRTPEEEQSVIAEDIAAEEPAFKDGSPAEPDWEEDSPPVEESAHEDAPPAEPDWAEESPPVEESAHEDVPPAEPDWAEESPPVEESAHEDVPPAEPDWEEESPPVEESAHEDVPPAEPDWAEESPPVEESGHEDAPSVEGPPVEDTALAEDAHRVEASTTGMYSSAAPQLPINGSTEAVQAHLVTTSVKDLALYGNWRTLTSKKRTRRARKLTEKGLPIPNEDGLVQIFAGGVRT